MFSSLFPASGSIRRRMFFLLVGMSFGSVLIVNLIWLPSAIREIKDEQLELRRVSIQLVRERVQQELEGIEGDLRVTALRMRAYFLDRDREQLSRIAQQLLQSEPEIEEVAILNDDGKELVKRSRKSAITDGDLVDRAATPLF